MERRLAAVLAADVAGYSRLMERDEERTHTAFRVCRAAISKIVADHHGRIFGGAGDSLMVEFASPVEAVRAGVEVQRQVAEQPLDLPEGLPMQFRIGINLGDVMVDRGELFGDGVNVAARLENLADPGGICISESVHQYVESKLQLAFEDLGAHEVKNIAKPVRVFRVHLREPAAAGRTVPAAASSKPSVAVLPFTNMSGDPEQEYFSDGITEDIITDLSRVSGLFLVARHTSFLFKGKAIDVGDAARQLNVADILEGSVRKAGNRVRITAQLVDGATAGHVWAERYDRELVDIFAVQDEIAKSIVAALKVRLLPNELESIVDRSTSNADAYECYLQGRAKFIESWGSRSTMRAAHKLFSKAAEIDPGYAKAYAGIAGCDAFLWVAGDHDISYERIQASSEKALQLAPDLAEGHAFRGVALFATGHLKEASAALARAIELDPVLFGAHFFYGIVSRNLGDWKTAASAFQRAATLRSDDFASLSFLADVYELLGQHEESKAAARRGMIRIESILSQRPDRAEVLAMGAANAVYVEEYALAEEWAQRAVQLEPDNYSVRYNAACAYAVMGKADIAMEHLEYIYSKMPRVGQLHRRFIAIDPQLKSLRGRTDFKELLKHLEAGAPSPS
jgi:adenylate cyclase